LDIFSYKAKKRGSHHKGFFRFKKRIKLIKGKNIKDVEKFNGVVEGL
jgi:hypothetical protein